MSEHARPPSHGEEVKIDLQKMLDTFEARRRYHHNALWEEEKHFTFLVSLIVPALAAVFVATGTLRIEERLAIIMAGSALGALVSYFGLTVVRRESVSFLETVQICNRITAKLGEAKERGGVELPAYRISGYEQINDTANHSSCELLHRIGKPSALGVRDCFQLVFLVMISLFVGAYAVAGIYLGAIHAARCGMLSWLA
jgi:hypothetical protein